MNFFVLLVTIFMLLTNGEEMDIVEKNVPEEKAIISLEEHIYSVCKKYNIEYELVLSIINVESEFDSKAVSYNKTSLGLMQLNKNTYPTLAKELGINNFDPFNPYHNTEAGVYYLYKIKEDLIEKNTEEGEIVPMMLLTYNRGATGAKKYASRNGVRSRYVDKVLDQKNKLERSRNELLVEDGR